MIIKNFGMFWERKYIHWGWQGNAGNLLGYTNRVEKVNFRRQSGVYLLHDKDLNTVYVGQAGSGNKRLFDRLKDHETDHLWNRWDYFSWLGLHPINEKGHLVENKEQKIKANGAVGDFLDEIEGVLIHVLEPKLNRQGAKWKHTEEYFQEIDENIVEHDLDDIYEKQVELEELMKQLAKKI